MRSNTCDDNKLNLSLCNVCYLYVGFHLVIAENIRSICCLALRLALSFLNQTMICFSYQSTGPPEAVFDAFMICAPDVRLQPVAPSWCV